MEELGRIPFSYFDGDPIFVAFCEVVTSLNALHGFIANDESPIRPQLEKLFCDVHNSFVSFSGKVM